MGRLLLCTDLDRTLLPNGPQPESPCVRTLFADLVARPQVTLAYVTGRYKGLVEQAIRHYALPWPDYVVGDVGTAIYTVGHPPAWQTWREWQREIGASWSGISRALMERAISDIDGLVLQEPEKQSPFKLSFYGPGNLDHDRIVNQVEHILAKQHIPASVLWSVDETDNTGLLDIIPPDATKLHAVQFLMSELGFTVSETLYAGDSGNDLPVLVSRIPAVLTANATAEVRTRARTLARDAGTEHQLCLAKGREPLNGNYAAGILEGVAHFHPHLAPAPYNRENTS